VKKESAQLTVNRIKQTAGMEAGKNKQKFKEEKIMGMTINTNVASLNAQRNLGQTQGLLSKSLERLSSGLRINSAKDDAAGLAISSRMGAQVRGLNQAVRNANDGISLAQTAEGGLQEVTNILQRMRELAVQSRNDTNTTSDRQSLDSEFQQLLAEVDRIAQTTAFNGRNVLDGTLGTATFQVGANVGETISIDVSSSMRTNSIGGYASVSYALANDLDDATADDYSLDVAGDWALNGVNVGAAVNGANGKGDGSAYAIAAAINLGTDNHGVTATVDATTKTVTAAEIANFAFTDNLGADDTLTYTLTINDQAIFTQGEGDSPYDADGLASQINGQQATTGVSASVQSNGDIILTAADGRNIEIKEVRSAGTDALDSVVGYFGNTLTGAAEQTNYDIHKSTINLSANTAIQFYVADADANNLLAAGPGAGATATTDVATLDVANILTTAASDLSINKIDEALGDVNTFRGALGAIQNRFESTVANLQSIAENISAAKARIMDADFAAETAEMTKAQVMQQAGVAMLAQANMLPQTVLSLLQ
jgi:flagellin